MARAKKTTANGAAVENNIEQPPIVTATDFTVKEKEYLMGRTHPMNSNITIGGLFRNCQTSAQQDQIMQFYKKYVNPKWNAELSNCCGNTFIKKFEEVRSWLTKNQHLFVN